MQQRRSRSRLGGQADVQGFGEEHGHGGGGVGFLGNHPDQFLIGVLVQGIRLGQQADLVFRSRLGQFRHIDAVHQYDEAFPGLGNQMALDVRAGGKAAGEAREGVGGRRAEMGKELAGPDEAEILGAGMRQARSCAGRRRRRSAGCSGPRDRPRCVWEWRIPVRKEAAGGVPIAYSGAWLRPWPYGYQEIGIRSWPTSPTNRNLVFPLRAPVPVRPTSRFFRRSAHARSQASRSPAGAGNG